MKSFLHPLIKSSKRIMEHLTVSLAYTISIYLLLFSTLISCLELSQVPKLYLDFVFPDINITNKWAKWLVLNYGCAVLIILAALLFFNDARDYFKIVFLSITLIVFYQYTVRTAGKDGADQLRMISFLTFTLCFLIEKEKGELLSICTVGFQVLVAYATSGVAKITSSHWRKAICWLLYLEHALTERPMFLHFSGNAPSLKGTFLIWLLLLCFRYLYAFFSHLRDY